MLLHWSSLMNSVLLFGTSPRPACAGAAPRIQPSSNHYREAMDGMAGGSDSDSEEGEEDGISRTPAPSCERRMRRGSAPIPTILQHRHGHPLGSSCRCSSRMRRSSAPIPTILKHRPATHRSPTNSQVHRLELLGFKADSNNRTSQAERAPPHDPACGTMRKHLFGK